jgi:hypothetical protein
LDTVAGQLQGAYCEVGSLKRDLNLIKHLVQRSQDEQQWVIQQTALRLQGLMPKESVVAQLRKEDAHNKKVI